MGRTFAHARAGASATGLGSDQNSRTSRGRPSPTHANLEMFVGAGLRSEAETGDGAAALAGLERHRATVQRGDLRDDRQPEARARERACAGGAVEAVEHPAPVLGVDAGTTV